MTNTLSSNVIILGKPGAGKSTISRALGETPDAHSIDFGEYLRELASDTSNLLGRYVSAFWSRNNLKEIGFEYFDREFKQCIDENLRFVLSSPKVLDDAKEIDEHLRDHKLQIDAVIELDAPSELCIERVDAKNATENESETYPTSEKIEHFEKHIEELRTYYQSQPHITYLTIDSSKPVDEVVSAVLEQVSKLEKKSADYSHVEAKKDEEDGEESSDEFFERLSGSRRAELVQLMMELAQNPKSKIPMTHAVPLYGGNINELGNRQYAIIRKLDSYRRLVIIYENTIYVVSAQYNVFKCALDLPEAPSCDWNNSLFDAELVKKNGESLLFLQDCLTACGNRVRDDKLAARLTFVKNFAQDFKDSNSKIKVFAQTFYAMNQLPILTKLGRNGDPESPVPSARCIAEGLMFIPTTLRYNIGCSRYLLTWRPVFLNTIDLAAFKEENEEGKPALALKSYKHKEGTYSTHGSIEEIPEPLKNIKDGTVVECNLIDSKWNIVKVRNDRNHPNADWVVEEAIKHAKQPVSQAGLLEKVKSVVQGGQKRNKSNKRY